MKLLRRQIKKLVRRRGGVTKRDVQAEENWETLRNSDSKVKSSANLSNSLKKSDENKALMSQDFDNRNNVKDLSFGTQSVDKSIKS